VESTRVGVILDSSVLIAAERRGNSILQIFEQVQASQGEIDIGLSVVTAAELIHGAYRARTPSQQSQRLEFIDRLCQDVPIFPITLEIAWLVGRIGAEQKAKGVQLAFEDLAIGATALHLGYSVATLNLRHFEQIPGLNIVRL
jgi:tRNA(fMet)-specific endonuclease VapC